MTQTFQVQSYLLTSTVICAWEQQQLEQYLDKLDSLFPSEHNIVWNNNNETQQEHQKKD